MNHVPLIYALVARIFWPVCLPGLWSLPLVSFSSPCLGRFLLIKFGRVSSFMPYKVNEIIVGPEVL